MSDASWHIDSRIASIWKMRRVAGDMRNPLMKLGSLRTRHATLFAPLLEPPFSRPQVSCGADQSGSYVVSTLMQYFQSSELRFKT